MLAAKINLPHDLEEEAVRNGFPPYAVTLLPESREDIKRIREIIAMLERKLLSPAEIIQTIVRIKGL